MWFCAVWFALLGVVIEGTHGLISVAVGGVYALLAIAGEIEKLRKAITADKTKSRSGGIR